VFSPVEAAGQGWRIEQARRGLVADPLQGEFGKLGLGGRIACVRRPPKPAQRFAEVGGHPETPQVAAPQPILGLRQPRLRRFDEQRKRPNVRAPAGEAVGDSTQCRGTAKRGPHAAENLGHSEHRAMLHAEG
jgi:hypothetical protein